MGWELSGYVASGLVLAAFYMKDMIPLRLAALASNVAFIAYGLALGLTPIWLLHALLVPLNGYRLVEAARTRARAMACEQGNALHRSHHTEGDNHGIGRNAAVAL
jgi:CRP/FNR family transcriptional regulator, cyclic AMP receptor protein